MGASTARQCLDAGVLDEILVCNSGPACSSIVTRSPASLVAADLTAAA